jgi:hypothetical protein
MKGSAMQRLFSLVFLIVLSLGLAACGGGGGGGGGGVVSTQMTWDQGNWDQKNWQ